MDVICTNVEEMRAEERRESCHLYVSIWSTFSTLSSILSYLHMPFLRSSTRPQPVQCFFCLSPSLLPPRPHVSPPVSPGRKGKERIAEPGTKWNWQCERCGCWNIRDAVRIAIPKDPRRWLSDFLTNWPQTGEMMSDLPAMHNSAFNSKSFALRGELQMLSHMLPVCSADISPRNDKPNLRQAIYRPHHHQLRHSVGTA